MPVSVSASKAGAQGGSLFLFAWLVFDRVRIVETTVQLSLLFFPAFTPAHLVEEPADNENRKYKDKQHGLIFTRSEDRRK